nr:hypothetical protein [Propionibacterium freudenreichii]
MEVIELAGEHVPQGGDDVLGNLHAPVVVLDLLLDVADRHGLTDAVGALGVPPGTHEVRVDVAVAVLGVGDHEPGTAVTAVDGAFQVVLVRLRLLPGDLVRGEDVLYPVPDLGADQRFVEAVVAGASEDHVALVVRVGEHVLDRGQAGGFRGALRRRHGRQPAVDQLAVQHRRGVVPGRVCLERPPHQRGTVRVEVDRRNVAAELVAPVDVEVADRCAADRPARGRLLRHALGDLVGEVAGVELRDGGHDAVQQHPARGLVNVLCSGDEHDPGVFERKVDRHVVGTIAGEPVDLVDDAVRDRVRLDVLDHPHEFGSVGLARGLARVHELLDHDGVQVAGLAEIRVALRGDRESLVAAAALCLLLGGYAQVGDGERRGLAEVIEA